MTPLRARLFNPPNAVPDTGINMRNGRPVKNNVVQFRARDLTKKPFVWPGNLAGDFWLPEEIPEVKVEKIDTVTYVMKVAAAAFNIQVRHFKQRRRDRPIVLYRQAAMALACRLTPFSLPHIGRAFGKYDHTTVLHAKRKMEHHIAAVAAELPADAPAIEWARAMKRRIAP